MITCGVCGTEMYNAGAVSMGDGDLSDEYICPGCGETKLVGTKWSFDGENWYDSLEEANSMFIVNCHDCEKTDLKPGEYVQCQFDNDEPFFLCNDCERKMTQEMRDAAQEEDRRYP